MKPSLYPGMAANADAVQRDFGYLLADVGTNNPTSPKLKSESGPRNLLCMRLMAVSFSFRVACSTYFFTVTLVPLEETHFIHEHIQDSNTGLGRDTIPYFVSVKGAELWQSKQLSVGTAILWAECLQCTNVLRTNHVTLVFEWIAV